MLVMQRAHDAGSLLSERMAKPEFSVGSVLQRIQRDGVVRVGVVSDAPGFSTRNPDTQRFEGLDIAVARKLVQSIFGGTLFMANRNIDFVEVQLTERVDALVEHRVDLVASVFAATDARRKLIDFSDPYYGAPIGVVVRDDSNIRDLGDVKKVTVALVPSTVESDVFAARELATKVLETINNDDTIDAVITGDADAGAMSTVLLDKYIAAHPELRRLPVALDNFPFAIGLPKVGEGNDDTLKFVNSQIREIVRQGYVTLAELVRKRDI